MTEIETLSASLFRKLLYECHPHSQVLYPNVFEYRRRRKRETSSERRARAAAVPNTARTTNRATADILRSVTKKRIDRADD